MKKLELVQKPYPAGVFGLLLLKLKFIRECFINGYANIKCSIIIVW